MNISALSVQKAGAAEVAPESLAGNQNLTEHQKIAEASRQFEAMLLRQILSEAQKPVIQSEFSDNSTAAGIYQDLATNQMADGMSKSGAFGFAQVFERQLDPPDAQKSRSAQTAPTQTAPAKLSSPPMSSSRHE